MHLQYLPLVRSIAMLARRRLCKGELASTRLSGVLEWLGDGNGRLTGLEPNQDITTMPIASLHLLLLEYNDDDLMHHVHKPFVVFTTLGHLSGKAEQTVHMVTGAQSRSSISSIVAITMLSGGFARGNILAGGMCFDLCEPDAQGASCEKCVPKRFP